MSQEISRASPVGILQGEIQISVCLDRYVKKLEINDS